MIKYILVGGYLQKADDGGKAFCEEMVKDVDLYRPIKILDCLFANPVDIWEAKFQEDKERFSKFITNFELILANSDNFIEQVKSVDVIFLRGGETDMLLEALNKNGNWLQEFAGKTIAGTSAGAMALVKYSHALEKNELIEGLGILPIKIIAHWKSDSYEVDWDKAFNELKNHNEDLPVYTLVEGEFMVIEQ